MKHFQTRVCRCEKDCLWTEGMKLTLNEERFGSPKKKTWLFFILKIDFWSLKQKKTLILF